MTLKIVYQICCGIDVHKTFVFAFIASTNKQGVTTYKHHLFSTFTQGLKELLQWLLVNHCKDVYMESPGKYWTPIYNVLEKDCTIALAHPKYVKTIRGKKTDKNHVKWIADLFKHNLVAGNFIPSASFYFIHINHNYLYDNFKKESEKHNSHTMMKYCALHQKTTYLSRNHCGFALRGL